MTQPNTASGANHKYQYGDDGLTAVLGKGADGREMRISVKDVRRERTGMHGRVAFILEGSILAYDTFNLGRHEERRKLASGTFKALSHIEQEEWTQELLQHETDLACLNACNEWEEARFQIEEIDPSVVVPPRLWVIRPYIQDGGGTILFGPPKAGKSHLMQLMAICIATGNTSIWNVARRPVLYVNMERPSSEFALREAPLRRILGISGKSGVAYLHVRGVGVRAVAKKVSAWVREHPGALVCYDSISRGQLGSLKEDDTANEWTDTANRVSPTWIAIGHTPRGDGTHVFGSVHFAAGADVSIQVGTEKRGNTMGVSLVVTEANASASGHREYLAFEFTEDGLQSVRGAKPKEFPDLAPGAGDKTEAIRQYMAADGKARTIYAIGGAMQMSPIAVDNLIRARPDLFVHAGLDGKRTLWGLISRDRDEV